MASVLLLLIDAAAAFGKETFCLSRQKNRQ